MYSVIRKTDFTHCPISDLFEILAAIILDIPSLVVDAEVRCSDGMVTGLKHWRTINSYHSYFKELMLRLNIPCNRSEHFRQNWLQISRLVETYKYEVIMIYEIVK